MEQAAKEAAKAAAKAKRFASLYLIRKNLKSLGGMALVMKRNQNKNASLSLHQRKNLKQKLRLCRRLLAVSQMKINNHPQRGSLKLLSNQQHQHHHQIRR